MIKRLTMKTTLKRARSTSKSRGLNLHEQPSELQVDCSSHAPKTPRSPISEMSQGGNYAWLVRTSCPRHEEAPEHDILKSFLQDLKTPKKMAERAEKCLSPVVQLSHSCFAEVILEQTHLDLGDRRLLSPPQRRSLGRVLFSHVRSASGHSLLNRRFSGNSMLKAPKRLFIIVLSCMLLFSFVLATLCELNSIEIYYFVHNIEDNGARRLRRPNLTSNDHVSDTAHVASDQLKVELSTTILESLLIPMPLLLARQTLHNLVSYTLKNLA